MLLASSVPSTLRSACESSARTQIVFVPDASLSSTAMRLPSGDKAESRWLRTSEVLSGGSKAKRTDSRPSVRRGGQTITPISEATATAAIVQKIRGRDLVGVAD